MKNVKSVNKSDTQLSLFPEMEQEHLKQYSEKVILPEYDHTALFNKLNKSDFRRSFHLKSRDIKYIKEKGWGTIQQHAVDFVSKRLAPAYIPNEGKQTPMCGHPVFIAQHATACCCRGCFSKWHHIAEGRTLTYDEQLYAVSVLMTWIRKDFDERKEV